MVESSVSLHTQKNSKKVSLICILIDKMPEFVGNLRIPDNVHLIHILTICVQ